MLEREKIALQKKKKKKKSFADKKNVNNIIIFQILKR